MKEAKTLYSSGAHIALNGITDDLPTAQALASLNNTTYETEVMDF